MNRLASVLVVGLAISGLVAWSQNRVAPQISVRGGFTVPITEDNRTVALVRAREAKPSLLAGQLFVVDFHLETFRYAPERATDLIVESPSSTFDANGNRAWSASTIQLRSADERLSVTGEGWLWEGLSGRLVISNRVHTTVRLGDASSSPHQPPVEIDSGTLTYNLKTGDTRFGERCLATQPGQIRLKAGEIVTRLGVHAPKPEAITATNAVEIEMLQPGREGKATGATAHYSTTEQGERIELDGSATWEFGPGNGSAEQLVLLPALQSYTARGLAKLRLRNGLHSLSTGEKGQGDTNREPVDIVCELIEARPGEIAFTGPVSMRQGQGLELAASRVIALYAENSDAAMNVGQPYQVTATGDVAARLMIRQSPLELRGQRMEYTVGEHAIIDVTDAPSWRLPGYEGRADRFVIHPETPRFQALRHVHVTWNATSASPGNDAPVQVESELMVVEALQAQFQGHVRAARDTWTLQAQEVDLQLDTNGTAQALAAHREVELHYLAPPLALSTNVNRGGLFFATLDKASETTRQWTIRGDEVRSQLAPGGVGFKSVEAAGNVHVNHVALKASGGRLLYHADDGLLRLVDHARLNSTDGLTIIGEPETALMLDQRSGRFVIDGPVEKLSLPARALRGATTKDTPGSL